MDALGFYVDTTIALPSGLACTFRGLKGSEGQLLASKEAQKSGTLFDQILEKTTLKLVDPGPYAFSDGRAVWENILVGDKTAAMLHVRALTYDDLYPFKIQCAAEQCRKSFEWQVYLSQLPRKTLAEADKAAFQNGNTFSAAFRSDGRAYTFHLLTGADTSKLVRLTNNAGENPLIAALMVRILGMEGVEPNDKKRFLLDRPLGDLNAAIADMDAHDCGVETDFEVECQHCGHLQEIRLPLDREFWLPSKEQLAKVQKAVAARTSAAAASQNAAPATGGTPATT